MSRIEKVLIASNIIFLFIIVIMSFYVVSNIHSLNNTVDVTLQSDENLLRYEMVFEGSKVIVFDKITGEYWTKFEATNEGPTNWTKSEDLMIQIRMVREFTTE
ncbi:hypothetical protein RJG79_00725 [Mycoplasmatota bacterium WC44]